IRKGELRFEFERKWRIGNRSRQARGVWTARLQGDKLVGLFRLPGQRPVSWIGERAPGINERDDGTWREGQPVELFNGKDLSGWIPVGRPGPPRWMVKDGILVNDAPAPNLMSEGKFWNFNLHVEYRVGPKSNSGIGLRGRYEVQILEDYGRPVDLHSNGAIYSRIPPSVNASKPAGEWQTFDIRLIGRMVTVVLNGVNIIDNREIEGLTAIAVDPHEALPGPILLQGDHGVVEFRKITLTPLVR
ncbi:MAG: 3-keto-disaccharide hydrolase, partial [Bryobacteraceae bacterium]